MKLISRTIVATLAVAFLGTAQAVAQDASQFYVGIFAGAATGFSDDNYPPDPSFEIDGPISGIVGGVFAGVDFQPHDGLVFGVEADFAGSTIGGTNCNNTCLVNDVNWISSLRARLGVLADQTLFYVTGGVAAASITLDYTDSSLLTIYGSETTVVPGATIGLGIDQDFGDGWFGRGEYRYSMFAAAPYGNGRYLDGTNVSLHTFSAGIGKQLN